MSDSTTTFVNPRWFRGRSALIIVGMFLTVVVAVLTAVSLRNAAVPDFLEQARLAQKRGDRPAAIAALEAHLKVAPESTRARLQLASLWRETRPEDALAILSVIPDSDPQSIAAQQETAIIHLLAGRRDKAAAALQALIRADPRNFGAQLSLAELYFTSNDPQAALPHALAAAELAPDRAQTFLLIADIYDELHDHPAMVEPLQTALALSPKLYAAHLNLAYVYHRLGELAEAAKQARWCLDSNPREVAALRILASIARYEGRFEEAETLLSKALQIQPDDVDCRILEADLLLYRRQPRAAYERLKKLYPTQRTTVRFLGTMARAAAAAGEREEARKLYQAVEELVQKSRGKTP